ncbi:MAG TPA: tRNA epoxyqueuosine(34) reductase QueG [Anaerolineae bacterium]|nr:tRNA epoxyqueuosine(34) reductase QueG [Anaerolineae bacterium]
MTAALEAIKARLKTEALGRGFDLVGVTTPDPPPHFEIYEQWLQAKRHGAMEYLASERARERRRDPRRIMPQCRSILVLASSYYTTAGDMGNAEARVAAYARGEDYHDIFIQRLAGLMDFLQAEVGQSIEHRIYTDTGPLLEKELAQRAGLGWIGKNTCLIHPRLGSYILLAEVLLDLELPPDEPFGHDRCGSCRRCLDACPTGCILPNRTLDANRCISYLTIEWKEAIPRSLRAALGEWVFGCDICQQVCPWNQRFARPKQDAAFQSRPFLESPDLTAFLELDVEAFRTTLRGNPIRRTKRRGLMRNAAIAAGNTGSGRFVPVLVRILGSDGEPIARSHAAWALGRIGGEEARQALQTAQTFEKEAEVLEEIEAALEEITSSDSSSASD